MADANRGQFGIDAFTKEGLHEIVEILAALRKQPEVLANIKKYSESCANWGEILSELLKSPRKLFAPGQQVPFGKFAQDLYNSRAVIISTKLPNQFRGADHYFTLEPLGHGNVRVLHTWQDMHTMRAENPIKIEEMMQLLKELPQLEVTPENVPRLQQICGRLWGPDHADPGSITKNSGRKVMTPSLVARQVVHFRLMREVGWPGKAIGWIFKRNL